MYVAPTQEGRQPDLGVAVAKKLAKVWTAQANTLNKDVVIKLKKPIGRQTRGKLRKKEKELLRAQISGLI